ncbi:hypothetical protein EYF80_034209 [Liparis tanakae]|uniref:Uncharacterized protein n=1 Tax=Liparis tanakae TaxID=230148 RepID=A0A4Z2GQH4_9TELE|nr:hypothetical protein EYF80_034209 [Liparis tanakae]
MDSPPRGSGPDTVKPLHNPSTPTDVFTFDWFVSSLYKDILDQVAQHMEEERDSQSSTSHQCFDIISVHVQGFVVFVHGFHMAAMFEVAHTGTHTETTKTDEEQEDQGTTLYQPTSKVYGQLLPRKDTQFDVLKVGQKRVLEDGDCDFLLFLRKQLKNGTAYKINVTNIQRVNVAQ